MLFGCSSAWAHSAFGTTGASVWIAPYHLFTAPLALASLVALALVLFGTRAPDTYIAALLATAGTVVATMLLPRMPPQLAPAVVVVMGIGAIAAWKPPTWLSYLLAVFAGLAAGTAAELEQPSWQDLLGMGVTVLVVTIWLQGTLDDLSQNRHLQTVLPIARRVVGSWITAMALLLSALAVFGKHV